MDKIIIAATRLEADFENALKSDVGIVFDLSPSIQNVGERAESTHKSGKKYFVHIDLAEGVGKDKSGILFLKNLSVDGIISTRVNIIKLARECGMFTVQRFFIVDSHSVDTTVEAVKASKPDMIEIMPGTVLKVIKRLRGRLDIPIIAGGLIENDKEAEDAIKSGATAISTGKECLWEGK